MENNLIQTRNILNLNTKSTSIRDLNLPKYSNLFSETNYSNYRRERDSYLNSYNNNNINNISTSLSSFEKYNINNPSNLYYNNPYRLSQSRSRSRSPCFCGCHSHEDCHHHLSEIICQREHLLQKCNNSLANKNEEMTKKNDDLINEIIYLKKNLDKIETELTRTKNEKEACNYYIKELEKELSKSNMLNESQSSQRRAKNYSKMREYEKYHDMLNKSFKVLDSVSNKCSLPQGKTRGGVNYYFNRDKDYDSVIKTQKKWINNLPMSLNWKNNNNNFSESENEKEPNEQDDSNYNNPNKYQSESNIYKYPEGYVSMNNLNNSTKIKPKQYYNTQKLPDFYNSSYPKKKSYNNNINRSNSNPKRKNSPYQSNFFEKHIMYKTNNRQNNNNKSPYYRNNSEPNIPKKNYTYNYFPNNNSNNNKGNNDNINNNEIKNTPPKERYLVIDKFGNPIFISGKRLLAMELMPYLDKEGKEQYDNNGNILFIGPDGNPRTQDDLQPIILNNEKPLVNEENKPFLGVDDVIIVNRFGNPILGPGELYDINNKVVKGELGILPKTNQGNLIKLNLNEEPLNENIDDYHESINDDNNNMNVKNPKQPLNKTDKNNNTKDLNNNITSKTMPFTIKPLLGSDGKPIRDKNNNPILLDKDGNPIHSPEYKLLLNKSGFPIFNTLGQPIILDKDQNPLDMDYNTDLIPDKKNGIQNYDNKYPELKIKKKRIKTGKNKKKKNNNKIKKRTSDNSVHYPKPNPSFQRKLNILPERINRFNLKEYLSTCFACDLGCSVSRSGYSPMTYSPYHKKKKRRDITPYK